MPNLLLFTHLSVGSVTALEVQKIKN